METINFDPLTMFGVILADVCDGPGTLQFDTL